MCFLQSWTKTSFKGLKFLDYLIALKKSSNILIPIINTENPWFYSTVSEIEKQAISETASK